MGLLWLGRGVCPLCRCPTCGSKRGLPPGLPRFAHLHQEVFTRSVPEIALDHDRVVVPIRSTPPAESSWRGNVPGRGRSPYGTNARGKGGSGGHCGLLGSSFFRQGYGAGGKSPYTARVSALDCCGARKLHYNHRLLLRFHQLQPSATGIRRKQ